jgi:hypothetical protein
MRQLSRGLVDSYEVSAMFLSISLEAITYLVVYLGPKQRKIELEN